MFYPHISIHLKIAGSLLVLLGLLHLVFPRYFKWKTELAGLSLINRQLMEVHTLFIGLMVFMMGCLCLFSNTNHWQSPMGKLIALGLSAFWLIRLLIQFFYYSPRLWRGKAFETIVHISFSMLWTYLSTVFVSLYRY